MFIPLIVICSSSLEGTQKNQFLVVVSNFSSKDEAFPRISVAHFAFPSTCLLVSPALFLSFISYSILTPLGSFLLFSVDLKGCFGSLELRCPLTYLEPSELLFCVDSQEHTNLQWYLPQLCCSCLLI